MFAKRWLAVAGAVGVFAHVASAEWERTISVWDTRLPDQGEIQATVWGGYATFEQGDETYGRLYLNYGLSDRWNVSLAPGFVGYDIDDGPSESGVADTSVSSTYRFMDEGSSLMDMAVLGGVSLPTGDADEGLGSDKVETQVSLIAAKTVGPVVVVANAGGNYVVDADDGTEDVTVYGALEGVLPVTERLSLNASLYAGTKRYEGGDDVVDIGAGFRFEPNDATFVGLVGYVCLTDVYDEALSLGAGIRF